MSGGISTELQWVIWGVLAQWLALLGSGIAYYMVRIRHDIRWKSNVENTLENLDHRLGGLEKNRRKEDRYQTIDRCQNDKLSCLQYTEAATKDMNNRIHDIQTRLEEMRKRSDDFHERRESRFDAIAVEISALKETVSSLATSSDNMARSIDRLMDHILKREP